MSSSLHKALQVKNNIRHGGIQFRRYYPDNLTCQCLCGCTDGLGAAHATLCRLCLRNNHIACTAEPHDPEILPACPAPWPHYMYCSRCGVGHAPDDPEHVRDP